MIVDNTVVGFGQIPTRPDNVPSDYFYRAAFRQERGAPITPAGWYDPKIGGTGFGELLASGVTDAAKLGAAAVATYYGAALIGGALPAAGAAGSAESGAAALSSVPAGAAQTVLPSTAEIVGGIKTGAAALNGAAGTYASFKLLSGASASLSGAGNSSSAGVLARPVASPQVTPQAVAGVGSPAIAGSDLLPVPLAAPAAAPVVIQAPAKESTLAILAALATIFTVFRG